MIGATKEKLFWRAPWESTEEFGAELSAFTTTVQTEVVHIRGNWRIVRYEEKRERVVKATDDRHAPVECKK